jgi:hypothetical protein
MSNEKNVFFSCSTINKAAFETTKFPDNSPVLLGKKNRLMGVLNL